MYKIRKSRRFFKKEDSVFADYVDETDKLIRFIRNNMGNICLFLSNLNNESNYLISKYLDMKNKISKSITQLIIDISFF